VWGREALLGEARESLVAIILEQQGRIEELEQKLNLNSRNSSKPPSSDGPEVPRKPKKEPNGRKPGGQPGHKGKTRALVPVESLSKPPIAVIPEKCKHCAAPLKGRDPHPVRHQQIEVPPIAVEITEHELHALTCGRCGKTTRAELPVGISPRLLGARLTAMVVMLSGCFRMTKREVQALLKALFSVEVSVALIPGCEKVMAGSLAPVMEEAIGFARGRDRGNMDETGWRERLQKAWLWTLVTQWVTVFKIHANRDGVAMKELKGEFAGTLTSDRYGVYNAHKGRRQLCWAHLLRDFEAIREMRGKPGNIGKRLLEAAEKMFALWHKVKGGTLSRRGFKKRLPYYRRQVEALLREGADMPHGTKARRTCQRILKLKAHLWTFAHVRGVGPTNNAAEQAIRPAVLWRKGSFGTHSEQGSRFAESILSVRATLKQQKRQNLLDFLTQAYQAQLSPEVKPPSLLPVFA
jgi:transposase